MKASHLCAVIAAAACVTSACSAFAAETATKQEKPVAAAAKDGTAKAGKNEPVKEPPMSDEKKAEMIDQTLEFGTQEERARAMGFIQKLKDPALRSRLASKMIALMKEEDDPDLLIKALTVLGEMKESSAVPLMLEKLEHPSEDVRASAVYALKKLNAVSSKEKLAEKLRARNLGENSNYTIALIDTLGEFKAAEVVPFVKESLQSEKTDRAIKENLVIFLGRAPTAESKEILLKIYKDEAEDETLRSYAVNSLAKLGAKEASADIKQVIGTIDSYSGKKRKKYYTLHLYSIAALAKLGDPDAVPKLIRSLRSNSAQVRLKAISLIKDFKEKRTIDILKYKMKYDQNPRVQKAAKKALEAMGVETEDKKEAKKDAVKGTKK